MQLFRACKQIHKEAEPVLYGGVGVVFDFATHIDVLATFWAQRSAVACRSLRCLKIAREVRCVENIKGGKIGEVDVRWVAASTYIGENFANLRSLDLKMWLSSGYADSFPVSLKDAAMLGARFRNSEDSEEGMIEKVNYRILREKKKEADKKWREWDWTKGVLALASLRSVKVTWWDFSSGINFDARAGGAFDSWTAGRLVADGEVRTRLVNSGSVAEGVMDIRCNWL